MKHHRALFRTIVSVVLALTFIAFAARGTAADDVDGVLLDVPFVNQNTKVWCWLAVSEMAIHYRDPSRHMRQCEMLEHIHRMPSGTCCGDPSACQRTGLGWDEIQAVLWHFGRIHSRRASGFTTQWIRDILADDHPIIAQIKLHPTSMITHVVIIRGIREVRRQVMTPYGPQVSVSVELLVNDPMQPRPMVVPYDNFIQVWVDSLIIDDIDRN